MRNGFCVHRARDLGQIQTAVRCTQRVPGSAHRAVSAPGFFCSNPISCIDQSSCHREHLRNRATRAVSHFMSGSGLRKQQSAASVRFRGIRNPRIDICCAFLRRSTRAGAGSPRRHFSNSCRHIFLFGTSIRIFHLFYQLSCIHHICDDHFNSSPRFRCRNLNNSIHRRVVLQFHTSFIYCCFCPRQKELILLNQLVLLFGNDSRFCCYCITRSITAQKKETNDQGNDFFHLNCSFLSISFVRIQLFISPLISSPFFQL